MRYLAILLTLLIFSCSKVESPVIYFSNASDQPISNIHCRWVNNATLTLPSLTPGESRSMSFYIKDNADFFGLVQISWQNGSGDSLNRNFYFREKHLPSIEDKKNYNYIQFYLDQEGLDLVTSDEADLSNKIKKMDDRLVQYSREYHKTHKDTMSRLVEVHDTGRDQDRYWLDRFGH